MANLTEISNWEDGIYRIETSDPVLGGEEGIANKSIKQLANRTKYLKGQVDNINRERTGYATKTSPAFIGVPTAPTAAASTNNAQIATTAFVKTAIAALVGSAPAALDTLEELARALAGDANLKATLLAEIGKKANATDFNALHDLFIGIPIPYPLSTVPTGCLTMNGQRFDTRRYPKLAQKYPSGQLPDLRGEFIRGWDNGRGVDAGRGLLSAQLGSPIVQESHSVNNVVSMSGNNLKQIGFDESKLGETPNITVKMTTAEPANRANNWHAAPGTYSNLGVNIQYIGRTRPRNIAYHYICLAE
nr:MAG TPA: tail fiber protein [Caudoviricetes sp.]